jgi:hypothetical protein
MEVSSCIRTYKSMSTDIFGSSGDIFSIVNPVRHAAKAVVGLPWPSGEISEEAICKVVEEQTEPLEREILDAARLNSRNVRLLAPGALKSCCFVCAIRESQHHAELIRSYLPRVRKCNDTNLYTIWIEPHLRPLCTFPPPKSTIITSLMAAFIATTRF